MITREQAANKLNILLEQAHNHAKAHNLQVFLVGECDHQRNVRYYPNYGKNMIMQIVGNLVLRHPAEVAQAIEALNTGADLISQITDVDAPANVGNPPLEIVRSGNEVIDPPAEEHGEPALPLVVEPVNGLADLNQGVNQVLEAGIAPVDGDPS